MQFSPSSLAEITKCGYKYYLTKVMGQDEPGKRGYNMLQGDIVGDAIQNAAIFLNKTKQLSDSVLGEILASAYEHHFERNGITLDFMRAIRNLFQYGLNESDITAIDSMAFAINCSPYEFKPPAPLKTNKISTNKKNLSMKIIKTMEDVQWFFEPQHPHYKKIRDAVSVQPEKAFEIPLGQPYQSVINTQIVEEQDVLTGRFDLFVESHGMPEIFEFKYTATPFNQNFVDRMVQTTSYALAIEGDCQITLFDIQAHNWYTAQITSELREQTLKRYEMARKAIQNQVYLPACGTDPYTTNAILCGFKCNCPFASSDVKSEALMV